MFTYVALTIHCDPWIFFQMNYLATLPLLIIVEMIYF